MQGCPDSAAAIAAPGALALTVTACTTAGSAHCMQNKVLFFIGEAHRVDCTPPRPPGISVQLPGKDLSPWVFHGIATVAAIAHLKGEWTTFASQCWVATHRLGSTAIGNYHLI